MWNTEKGSEFTALTGEVRCAGEGAFHTGDGDYTLNGKPMEKQTGYVLKDGDVINDLSFKSPTSEDLIWKFS